jgi:hypothetical protein
MLRFIPSALAAAASLAAIALTPARADAAEGLKSVGVQAGFSGVTGSEGQFGGYGGAVAGTFGLGDTFALIGNASFTSNQVTATGGRSLVASQAIGLRYALDVIQFVPYVGVLAASYELTGGGLATPQYKFGAQIALGVDYLVSRKWLVGLELRTHALPNDILSSPSNPTPFYMTSFVKLEYVWGWF